ncbi:MAG: hypothetical protein VW397_03755, partial [Candidatus Margulisiibacteriota bacterium]
TKPCEIYELKKCQYRFRLIEGKNRQIRRMIETCETFVTRLKRLQFGDFSLGSILPGQYKFKSLKDDFYCRLKQTGISID